MKQQILGLSLFAATASVIAFYPATQTVQPTTQTVVATPPLQQSAPVIEVVFALDTTGSMGGLIDAAKEKIWSIASTMAQADPAPQIRMGLVAYRDQGDDYVTRVVDLSADLDSMYAQLMEFEADGGGDHPEAVNEALNDAVNRISWSETSNTYRVVFLVGDAPPHQRANGPGYSQIVHQARQRGIVVNAIRCGNDSMTGSTWQQIAALGGGQFLDVEQNGNAVAITTPFDEELARLSVAMDDTRVAYGGAQALAEQAAKAAATEKLHAKASVASRARRAAYNLTPSGVKNFLGDNDLVAAVSSGEVSLAELAEAELPPELQAVKPEARQHLVEKKAAQRAEIKSKLNQLAAARDAYISKEVGALEDAAESFEHKLYETVRAQSAAHGMRLDAAPKH